MKELEHTRTEEKQEEIYILLCATQSSDHLSMSYRTFGAATNLHLMSNLWQKIICYKQNDNDAEIWF